VSGRSVWLAGMVRQARSESGKLSFEIWFTDKHDKSDRRAIEQAIVENLRAEGFDGDIAPIARLQRSDPAPPERPATVPGLHASGGVAPHGGPIHKHALDGVRHIVCVASGKGGVGKSTVAVNLAVALARLGRRVGLLDADIYGPSLPTMLNIDSRPLADADRKILPVLAYGVRCLSVGMLVPSDEAIIWRGPMVMGALRQFLQDTKWGDLDVLVVDLPPGTGDAQLSIIQAVPLAGAVIVTTPQKVALDDAIRGIAMFRKLDVPILGLVENMAWYELPDGTRDHVFGEGGGVAVAEQYGAPVLGQIPLQTRLRASADAGVPAALADDTLGRAFRDLALGVLARLGEPAHPETPA
jgi:ATP-binding protein involved in chromosome partitioning